MDVRLEALMDNLAVAVMQANSLAADAPQYESLAETVAYALDLAELGLTAEENAFDSIEPRKAR